MATLQISGVTYNHCSRGVGMFMVGDYKTNIKNKFSKENPLATFVDYQCGSNMTRNKCGLSTLGQNGPSQVSDCTNDKSVVDSCCQLSYNYMGSVYKMCDITRIDYTKSDYKTTLANYINPILAQFNATFADYSCNGSYLTLSLIMTLLIFLLF